jgi:outer membrane protein with beta-barrel domain
VARLRSFAASARHTPATVLVVLGLPALAAAQPYGGATAPHRGSLEVSGGIVSTGGYDAGSADATLTTAGSAPRTLFTVDGEVKRAPGAAAAVGIYLGRRVSVEAVFQYARPLLRARLTGDLESASETDADARITSYVLGGSLLYHFGTGRFSPFVSGGAGQLRQLSENNADLLIGTEVHAGGGLKYWLATGRRRVGLRLDIQGSARSRSIAFEQKRRILPTVTAGLSYLF